MPAIGRPPARKPGRATLARSVRRAIPLLVVLLQAVILSAQPHDYRTSIGAWRAEHDRKLRAEDGWLAVVGLAWLEPGENAAGSAATAGVRLPAPAPPAVGRFRLERGLVTFTPAPDTDIRLNGRPLGAPTPLRSDAGGAADKLSIGSLTLYVIERGGRLGIRIKDSNSEPRRQFAGERWYPVQEAWRVTGRFVPHPTPKAVPIVNALGQVENQPSPGYVAFTIGGREYRLDPIAQGGPDAPLFFIFKDRTAGATTYPAGRFLYADPPRDGRVELDFNKAENPPCAFTPFATCPLPPKQNELPVRIEAGELYEHR